MLQLVPVSTRGARASPARGNRDDVVGNFIWGEWACGERLARLDAVSAPLSLEGCISCTEVVREQDVVDIKSHHGRHTTRSPLSRLQAPDMPQKSPFQIDIPLTDVLSYVFPKDTEPYDKPIWIDAAQPDNSLSPKQLLQWVKRLGVGLDRLNIGQNECVLMYSTNHIFVPVAYLGIAGSGRVFSGCNPAYTVNGRSFPVLILAERQSADECRRDCLPD